jgi:hypothetical protein
LLREKKKWVAGTLRETQTTELINTNKFSTWKIDNKKTVDPHRVSFLKTSNGKVISTIAALLIVAAGAFIIPKFFGSKSSEAEQVPIKNSPPQLNNTPAAQVAVPDLRGRTLDEAKKMLEQLHLQVGDVSPVSSTKENVGKVVRQFPRWNQQVDPQTQINLSIGE